MRVLLDEQLPRQLAPFIEEHEVRTVQQCGWAGLTNGASLERAAGAGFDVLVTADQRLQFQRNLAASPLGVVVIVAPSNAIDELLPRVSGLMKALKQVEPGEIVFAGG